MLYFMQEINVQMYKWQKYDIGLACVFFSCDVCQGIEFNWFRELFICTEFPNDELTSIHT